MSAGRKTRSVFGLGLVAAGFAAGLGAAAARDALPRFTPLMSTSKTVMDEPIVYPTGAPAKLTAGISALQPGDETGWHTHGMPMTGIILEGELTVDYGERGTRTYRQGDVIAEAITVPHNGRNTGAGPMRLFAVFVGAEGLIATKPIPATPLEAPR